MSVRNTGRSTTQVIYQSINQSSLYILKQTKCSSFRRLYGPLQRHFPDWGALAGRRVPLQRQGDPVVRRGQGIFVSAAGKVRSFCFSPYTRTERLLLMDPIHILYCYSNSLI